jgi:enoyl-CoA hydratase/carnithine racemase
MADPLLLEIDGPVATLTINRPEARNPLGEEGDGALFEKQCGAINANHDVRCVILTGAGKAFSAGGNVKAMREKAGPFAGSTVDIRNAYRTNIHRIVRSVWGLEVPVIAAVNGPAIGLGNDVACMADIRIASEGAVMGATFLKLGLVPGDGGAWLLPRVLGWARASELLFSGRTVNAQEALEWGLVSRVVPDGRLMEETRALAAEIAAQPPHALRMTKRLMREGIGASFEAIMDMSASMQALAHHTEDHMEALDAFFEKRKGDFKGR